MESPLLWYLAINKRNTPASKAVIDCIHNKVGFAESKGVWFGFGFSIKPELMTKRKNQNAITKHTKAASRVPNTLTFGAL